MTFFDIAAPLAKLGIPQIRIRPGTKEAKDADWPVLATTDLNTLKQWSDETPNFGAGSVAKAEPNGYWYLEADRPEFRQRLEEETGQKIEKCFRVRSRAGRGHYYFRQNNKSIQLGNISQGSVKDKDFSVRVHNQYVVSPGTLHPVTNLPYEIIDDTPIAEAPDWLIEWLCKQKVETKPIAAIEAGQKIASGSRNVALTSMGGKMRHIGMSQETIQHELSRINQEQCTPPLPEHEVETIAWSVSRYKPADPNPPLLFNGQPGGSGTATKQAPIVVFEEEQPEEIKQTAYPVFPSWIFKGTSVFEGLVEPYCKVNSRYEEYMYMPAIALMLNYVALRVRVENTPFIPSLYMIMIGRKGKTIKSSSFKSAQEYFEYAGMVGHAKTTQNNADGRALIWTAGSPEGLGLDMVRKNCKNGILFYDELATLVSKAGIESSGLNAALLTLYESDKYSNIVKNPKESFALEPNSYCMSLIACTTDKNFRTHWSRMCGTSSGLNDRFFFLFQPKQFKEVTPPVNVNTQEGALRTRKLVDRAIDKGVYSIDESDYLSLQKTFKLYSNRTAIRAMKFALFFTIDMGLDEISGDAIERANALIEYETAVKKYLRIGQADGETREAVIQQEILFRLSQEGGTMGERDLFRKIGQRFGETVWAQSIKSLDQGGDIRRTGRGTKASPRIIQMMRDIDYEDED